ncbi:MAG: A/G-specific adenine glycosylase [Pseudomonadota bacterium]|jgi:A/G-specific adenine glycosylase
MSLAHPLAASALDFFPLLVDWQRRHGRSGLPWQGTRDPYRVWLSEIMLQQTQVATVLGYYPRFIERFPDVRALAGAPLEAVLALWSGLGYYSRARNLHRCAQTVVEQWGGAFPASAQQLETLPGIGRSTAAAIAAFCFGERISILDGNVKRVLSRLLAFDGDLAVAAQERRLWELAQGLLPPAPTADEMVAWTQGLMDLGSSLCSRSRPDCASCPGAALCQARAQGRSAELPVRSRKLKRSTLEWWWFILRRGDGAVWLEQRPADGIWAGLYSLPTYSSRAEGLAALGGEAALLREHDTVRHVLTHRDLVLRPLELDWSQARLQEAAPAAPAAAGLWVRRGAELDIGLPAPLRSLLERVLPA